LHATTTYATIALLLVPSLLILILARPCVLLHPIAAVAALLALSLKKTRKECVVELVLTDKFLDVDANALDLLMDVASINQ